MKTLYVDEGSTFPISTFYSKSEGRTGFDDVVLNVFDILGIEVHPGNSMTLYNGNNSLQNAIGILKGLGYTLRDYETGEIL